MSGALRTLAEPAAGPAETTEGAPSARTAQPSVPGRARLVVGVAVVAIGLGIPFVVDDYWVSTFGFVLIAAIGALGLDVLTGRTGQISLGHAFFLGAGAYVGGYLGADLHLTAALWIPAAGLVAGLLGAVAGPAALRLRGLYLAIVTIGMVYIGQYILIVWSAFSGGPGGRAMADPTFGSVDFARGVTVAGLTFDRNACYYYLALLVLALGMLYVRNIEGSNLGRAMLAVRDRELAAAVLGVNLARTKVRAFVISSVLAGISGALYGAFLGFVVPTQIVTLQLSILYVIMIVVGGMASLWGPLLGALFVVGLPALLQSVSSSLFFLSTGGSGGVITPSDAADIVFGILLVAFLVLEPRGVVGLVHRAARWLPSRDGGSPRGSSPVDPGAGA